MSVLTFYFGWPDGAVWSNLLASAICAGLVYWRLNRQAARHHVQQMALAARHHFERLTQAEDHHLAQLKLAEAQVELAEKHQQELLDRQDAHALSLQAHVTVTARKGGGL